MSNVVHPWSVLVAQLVLIYTTTVKCTTQNTMLNEIQYHGILQRYIFHIKYHGKIYRSKYHGINTMVLP